MAHAEVGDTSTLVGGVLNIRHNANFEGGLDAGGSPSSVAFPKEHIAFLQDTIRRHEGLYGASASPEALAELDEDLQKQQMLAAKFAEAQVRALVDSELETCLTMHESLEFWQSRMERHWGVARSWLEMGPFTWKDQSLRDVANIHQQRMALLSSSLRRKVMTVGALQGHLTRMKLSFTEGKLTRWTVQAMSMIEEHLRDAEGNVSLEDGKEDGPAGGSPRSSPTSGAPRKQPPGGGRGGANWTEPSVQELMAKLLETAKATLEAVQSHEAQRLPSTLSECVPPSRLRRYWLYLAIGLPLLTAAGVSMVRNRDQIVASTAQLKASLGTFIREHITEPGMAIYNEVVHNSRASITDVNALRDAKQSLQHMLDQFVRDRYAHWTEDRRLSVVQAMDMSVVSTEYERSLPHAVRNVVTGDIVRMLLIQVQFIKKELLVAMSAIEDLMDENEFNLRVMATIPAFMLAYFGYRATTPLYYAMRGEKSRAATFTAMRMIVLAMERLLNMRNASGPGGGALSRGDVDRWTTSSTPASPMASPRDPPPKQQQRKYSAAGMAPAPGSRTVAAIQVLDELDLGKLVLLIYQFRRLFWSSPRRFSRDELLNIQEDLAELLGERGLISVQQQLSIVQRMGRSYKFLRLPSHTPPLSFLS